MARYFFPFWIFCFLSTQRGIEDPGIISTGNHWLQTKELSSWLWTKSDFDVKYLWDLRAVFFDQEIFWQKTFQINLRTMTREVDSVRPLLSKKRKCIIEHRLWWPKAPESGEQPYERLMIQHPLKDLRSSAAQLRWWKVLCPMHWLPW